MSPALAAVFVLFNGQNLDGWNSLKGKWLVENDAIVCKSAGAIQSSFESDVYQLTFEYRSPGRTAETFDASRLGSVTVHDGLNPVEKGVELPMIPQGLATGRGIMGNLRIPPDEWIRAEVTVEAEKITVRSFRSDGQQTCSTTWKNSRRARGFITFTAHQPGLQIRNIKVSEPGFENLFDGKSTKGWESVGRNDPDNPTWYVEKGTLICRHTKWGNWLRTSESYDNFVLRLEYWLPQKGNSGIYLHAPATSERISQIGQEIQLIDDSNYPKLKPSQRNGSVYAGIAPEVDVPAPAEEWNAIEVFSQGKRIRTTVNGVQLYDARLDDKDKDAMLLNNPLATRRLTGFIGLQDHTDSPKFRNIRIRVLPPESQPAG